MKYYKKWASQEHSLTARVMASLLAGSLFAVLIPYCLIVPIPRWDLRLHLPSLSFDAGNYLIGAVLIGLGVVFAWWSIGAQLFQARGTPIPMMPTHRLLVGGAFSRSRNPMAFGAICAYLGISILVGSLASVAVVVIFAILLLTYIKVIEEKELALRFGQEYLDYKAVTPFFFPRIFRKK